VRIVRYADGPRISFGVVETSPDDPFAVVVTSIADPFGPPGARDHGPGGPLPLESVRLLAPVLPGKVLCVGKNYADHVREMGGDAPPERPLLFLKPPTSVIGPGEAIARPGDSDRVDYEGELAVVIARRCAGVSPAEALGYVFGYTCANDVTARDQQSLDGQWTRAKGHDTFCPLGPWIETELDPSDLAISTTLDGEVRQSSRTKLLLRDVPTLLAYMSAAMTLLPGDVVLTGTPGGVGPMLAGQNVTVSIEGIGSLTNPVV
jgi:2-keto-4-pentenoate hydratase/2-oxohepta-3-ene-1,7-dioic acid hydratase in catechol pathway